MKRVALLGNRATRIYIWLLGLYLGLLCLIGFWPTPVDQPFAGALGKLLHVLHELGVPGWINYGVVEFSANVALFVPLGMLMTLMLVSNNWWMAVVASLLASLCIEACQAAFLSGRYSSALDVAANTAGAILGTAAVIVWRVRQNANDSS